MADNNAVQKQLRRWLRSLRRPCHICKLPIDYDAHYLAPLAFTMDHLIPLNKGGTDTRNNVDAAHRRCNRLKSDKLPTQARTFETTRKW